jgi:hypothetical protein
MAVASGENAGRLCACRRMEGRTFGRLMISFAGQTSEVQMRLSLVGLALIVLALAGLAPSSAAAQRYSKYLCQFGYGNVLF